MKCSNCRSKDFVSPLNLRQAIWSELASSKMTKCAILRFLDQGFLLRNFWSSFDMKQRHIIEGKNEIRKNKLVSLLYFTLLPNPHQSPRTLTQLSSKWMDREVKLFEWIHSSQTFQPLLVFGILSYSFALMVEAFENCCLLVLAKSILMTTNRNSRKDGWIIK